MTPEQAEALRAEFSADQVGQLPKGGKMLDYVGHAAARLRLLDVDLEWNWEPVGVDERGLPIFDVDATGSPIGFWIRLTVGGVTRLGYGSCPSSQFDAEKVLIGDALRNAAMSFGVATYLWVKGHSGDEEPGEGPRTRKAREPKDEGFMGFGDERAAKVAHEEFSKEWRKLPEAMRPRLPEDWPVSKHRLDVLIATVGALLSRPFDDVPAGPPQNTSLPLDTAPVP